MRTDENGGKRVVRIDGQDFIGRFLQHVLPPGFKRIRHFGLLSPAHKREPIMARAIEPENARAMAGSPHPYPLPKGEGE